VVIPHRAILRLVCGTDFLPWGAEQRFLLMAPTAFDASTLELWGPLLHGGCCVVLPEGGLDPERLGAVLRDKRVSCLWLTAGLFNVIVDQDPGMLRPVRHLLTGGEALSVAHVRRAREALPGVRLLNGYGRPNRRPLPVRTRSGRRIARRGWSRFPSAGRSGTRRVGWSTPGGAGYRTGCPGNCRWVGTGWLWGI
jgi:hypothetical protein